MNARKKIVTAMLITISIFNLAACNLDLPTNAKELTYTLYAHGSVDRVHWKVWGINGTLIIDGDGPMPDITRDGFPWNTYAYSKVVIKEGITSISDDAFHTINAITIPASVSAIGENSCDVVLKAINVDNSSDTFASLDGVLFSKDGTCLLRFPSGKSKTGYSIPDGTTSIGSYAFSNSQIEEVVFPDGLTTIGDNAFAYCWYLKNVNIPDNVCTIGKQAFQHCIDLYYVKLPDGINVIQERAFYDCRTLESIIIPSGVTSIESCAFESCDKLLEVVFPQDLRELGDSAFKYCDSLIKVSLPESVLSIGDCAFEECGSLTKVSLPESVLYIGEWAFATCSSLEQVEIPAKTICVGDGAFAACKKLTQIKLAEGNQTYQLVNNALYSIDGHTIICFPAGREEESFTILDSTTEVENYAFCGCERLDSVCFSERTVKVGDGAFARCGISDVALPDSLKTIGERAFSGCENLKSIHIPPSVNSIGPSAFSDCQYLTDVELPEGILSISEATFEDCKQLKIINIPSTVTQIDDRAFCGCINLTEMHIPDGVVKIGNKVFWGNAGLKTIYLPKSVIFIGEENFFNEVFYSGTRAQWDNISIGQCNVESQTVIHYNG